MSRPYYPPGAFSPPPAPSPNPPAEPQAKRRSGLGAAALLLAVVALLLGWIPVIGLTMLIPAGLAVMLGTIGFIAAVVTGRTGKGLPFLASLIGVTACLIPPTTTAIATLAAVPWVYTVGMDQVQIELEHELKTQGVEADQAERVGQAVGDVLRQFAEPGQWREGISLAHRFGRIVDDYENKLHRLDDADEPAIDAAAETFVADLRRLADRYDLDLADEDFDVLMQALQQQAREQVEHRRQWRHRHEQHLLEMEQMHLAPIHVEMSRMQVLDAPEPPAAPQCPGLGGCAD